MALKKQVFAAALSHGLDPVVAATWNPDLPRTPRVLVPIQVDALVVRGSGGTWADCRMRSPSAEDPVPRDASELLPPPFTDLAAPRPRGVHLHWALPDGLTRGVGSAPPDDATGAERARLDGVQFQAIPNRWVVARLGGGARVKSGTRLAVTSLSRRTVTAWVIESDLAEPRVTPLSEWSEPGPQTSSRKPLTALGHGDPAWSAYYDNVAGRLAFHDALDGVASGPLAYLVCGWYADPALDPLGDGIGSLSQFEQRLKELGWELPKGSYGQARRAYERVRSASLMGLATREAVMTPKAMKASTGGGTQAFAPGAIDAFEGGAQAAALDRLGNPEGGYHRLVDAYWPRYILCHGGVVGLGWPDEGIPAAPSGLLGGAVGGPPPASAVRIAVGHTMTDALAAMLAANNRTPAEARALEAALLGAAEELDAPDAAARVDVRVHAASFGSLPGGSVTETVMQRPLAAAPRGRAPDPAKADLGIFKNVQPRAGVPPAAGTRAAGSKVGGTLDVKLHGEARLGGVKVTKGRDIGELIAKFGERTGKAPAAAPAAAPNPDPKPVPVEVQRALPRFFIPSDPVFLVQGLGRSFKHGGDGRFSERGRLPCRVSGMLTTELAPQSLRSLPGGGRFRGGDVLSAPLANGSLPPDCAELLEELAVLDPGSATFGARSAVRGDVRLTSEQVQAAARTFAVEQTVWWVSRDPRRDIAPLAAASGLAGHLPCPIAVSPPARPWVPLHLDWEVEYLEHPLSQWQLGEVDFDAQPQGLPDAQAAGTVLRGRALLTAGAAQTAAATVRQAIARAQSAGGSTALKPRSVEQFHSQMAKVLLTEVATMKPRTRRTGQPEGGDGLLDTDELRSVADALAEMDVLGGALDRFHTRLRGGFVADGESAPAQGEPAPAPFVALRAGFLRVRRLRLVDCFGQVLDLAGSSATTPADMAQIVRSEPMTVQGRPDLLELAPRFTAPTRLMLRFIDAGNDAREAQGEHSPVAGFLLPDHLDAELQFHGDDGAALGAVRFDVASGVLWEDAPGRPATVGASPARAIANRHLAGIAQGLLDWGIADTTRDDPAAETALSALLRVIDTTLWTVDPFAHAGDEHLSLLVGHPIAVLRARLTLEVDEPIRAEELATHRVPVRLGALAQWQDGLLGYFVDDDYRRLHLPDPAAAGLARPIGPGQGFLQSANRTSGYYTRFAADLGIDATEGASPVQHDFVDVDDNGLLMLRPGQTVMLTLLVEPHSQVHATSGLLPRKALGMRREWVAPGLAAIAPSFRFGPVMVDPKRIRMPVASELRGSWSWCHRVDATTWQEDEVVNASGDAQLPRDPVMGQEGWLRLNPEPKDTP